MTLKGSDKAAKAGAEMRLNMVAAARPPLKGSKANKRKSASKGEEYQAEEYDLLVATCSNNKQAVVWKVTFERGKDGKSSTTTHRIE
jgi:hypothetical protein